MTKLRNFVIRQILDELRDSGIEYEKFNVTFSDDFDSSNLVKIYFEPNQEYSFDIDEYRVSFNDEDLGECQRDILKTTEQPGDYKKQEVKTYECIDECISRVYYWVENLKDELAVNKVN